MSQETFPQDFSDPFNQENSKQAKNCSWKPESYLSKAVAPKWKLQTTEEREEQENTVKKLESKLNRLKQRPDNHYSYKRMPDVSQYILSSDSENEDEVYDQGNPIEEGCQEEGLPLLWKNKSTSLQDTPKKTENQYYHPGRFFSCCFNC